MYQTFSEESIKAKAFVQDVFCFDGVAYISGYYLS